MRPVSWVGVEGKQEMVGVSPKPVLLCVFLEAVCSEDAPPVFKSPNLRDEANPAYPVCRLEQIHNHRGSGWQSEGSEEDAYW